MYKVIDGENLTSDELGDGHYCMSRMAWRCKFLHRQSFTSKDLSLTKTRGMAKQMTSFTCWNAEKNAERRLKEYLVALRERQSMFHKTTCKFVSDHFSFSLVNFPFLSRSIPAYLTVRIKYSFFFVSSFFAKQIFT